MKHIFLFIFFACNHLFYLAQDNGSFQMDWGSDIPVKKKEDFFLEKLRKSDTLYSAHVGKKSYFIRSYDLKNNKLIKETPINPVYNNQTYVLIDNVVFGDQMLFLSYYWDKLDKTKHYVVHTIEDGKITNPSYLYTITSEYAPYKNYSFQAQKHQMVPFEHTVSDNGQFLMIFFYAPLGLSKNIAKTQTFLLDRNLQIVKRGQLDWDNNTHKAYQLSNDGKLFYSLQDELGVCDGDTSLLFPIDFPMIPKSWSFKIFPDNSGLVFGYSQDSNSYVLSKVFFLELGSDYLVKNKVIQEISRDLLPVQEDIYGDIRYNIHDLILKENGERMLLLELYAHDIKQAVFVHQNGSVSTRTFDSNFFGHIVAVNYDPAGKITGYSCIPRIRYGYKNSTDVSDESRMRIQEKSPGKKNYTSFFCFQKENDVFIVYDDPQLKDENALAGKSIGNHSRFQDTIPLNLAVIPNSGTIRYQKLYGNNRISHEALLPMCCYKVDNDQIYIAVFKEKKKKLSFAKVTLR